MSRESADVMDLELLRRFEQAVRKDGRYALEAFEFLHSGLDFAARYKHGEPPTSEPRHVTGQELAGALRVFALRRWGPLARMVLRRWNINRTRDFGEMVYLLIDLELMGKQDSDDVTDFDDVYDFDTAFESHEIDLDSDDDDEGAIDQ